MTARLYYRHSELKEFEATVVSSDEAPAGRSVAGPTFWVTLDRTAFYPTSGGQPNDIGLLGEAGVIDVFEGPDNRIIHVTDRPIPVGPIRGSIQFERRFDHMQQHTGSHVLSAAFSKLYGIPAVSFHLGRELSTIDVAIGSLTEDQLQSVERACNQVIIQNLPITARMDDATELAAGVSRRDPCRNKPLRVVEIEGWDAQPCGGTHVAKTGEIGLILLRKLGKAKSNCRIEFVCGARAAQAAQNEHVVLREASQKLSCTFANLPTAIASVLSERDMSLARQENLNVQMARLNAELLLEKHAKAAEDSLVVHIFETTDAQYLKLVALRLVENPGTVVLLGSRLKGAVVFAQAAGLSADMHALLRSVVLLEGGKGGGTRNFAQGMVNDPANLERSLDQACRRLQEGLTCGITNLPKTGKPAVAKLRWASVIGD